MCDSMTLGGIGSAFNIYSNYKAGAAAQASADRNALLLDIQAVGVERQGAEAAARARARGVEVVGAAEVAMSASGTDVDVDALAQTSFMAEWEASTVRANARREAWGLRERADLTRYEGEQQASAYRLNAYASIIGAAGDVADYSSDMPKTNPASSTYSPGSSFTVPGNSEYSVGSIGRIR